MYCQSEPLRGSSSLILILWFIVPALDGIFVRQVREIRRAVLLNRALDDNDSDTEWENPETIDSRATPRPESTTGMITSNPPLARGSPLNTEVNA